MQVHKKKLSDIDFKKQVKVVSVRIRQAGCSEILPKVKRYFVKIPKVKSVVIEENGDRTLLLTGKFSNMEKVVRKRALKNHVCEHILTGFEKHVVSVDCSSVQLDYDNYTVDEVFDRVFGPELAKLMQPHSLNVVGHVLHLNLRDERQSSFRQLIAEVFLSKMKHIETVVCKVGSINNQYRVPELEVVAGKNDLNVSTKHNGCLFKFNYGEVYWNSRLNTMHGKCVDDIPVNTKVIDAFCGVGPFVIPAAARKNCTCYANDLNIKCIEYLKECARLNKVSQKIHTYNMDAMQFLPFAVKLLYKTAENGEINYDANLSMIIMNLPADSIRYLTEIDRAFRSLFDKDEKVAGGQYGMIKRKPVVRFYYFVKLKDLDLDVNMNVNVNEGEANGTNNSFNQAKEEVMIEKIRQHFSFMPVQHITIKKIKVVSTRKLMLECNIFFESHKKI